MARYYVRETFFRPELVGREDSTLPARLYNDLALALKGHSDKSVFVPIRTMQYLAVVESDEIVFVDSQGGYAHQDGEGGRLIRLAWRPQAAQHRDSLTAAVPYEILYYCADGSSVQSRLICELQPALRIWLERHRTAPVEPVERRVIALRPAARRG